MPKCKHCNVKLTIAILRWVHCATAVGAAYDHQCTLDEPVALYVETQCADCGLHGQYNAYSNTYCRIRNREGLSAGARWPRWLRERLILACTSSAAVEPACLACGVPLPDVALPQG